MKRLVFARLFRENYPSLLRFVERHIDDREVAKELTADSFTVLWEKLDATHELESAWLFRVARNAISNHYRRSARRGVAYQQLGLISEPAEAPSMLEVERRILVRTALTRLTAHQRMVVFLTYWEGLSAAEVGHMLGMGEGAVWTSLRRSRQTLRVILLDS